MGYAVKLQKGGLKITKIATGVNTSPFSVSGVYDDYKGLNISNFILEIYNHQSRAWAKCYGYTSEGYSNYAGGIVTPTYDASTGSLTIPYLEIKATGNIQGLLVIYGWGYISVNIYVVK